MTIDHVAGGVTRLEKIRLLAAEPLAQRLGLDVPQGDGERLGEPLALGHALALDDARGAA
jgi:hypothetical protein